MASMSESEAPQSRGRAPIGKIDASNDALGRQLNPVPWALPQRAESGSSGGRFRANQGVMQADMYRQRRGAFSRGEWEWRVEPDALVVRAGAGRERRYRWRDIVCVRLFQDPARARPWRFVFELQPKHQRKIIIDNAHYVSRREFEDRSAEYRAFVQAALAALAAANPKARALIGETPKRYFFLLVAALIGLGALAFVLATVPTPIDAYEFAPLVKLGLVALMLPVFWRWVIGAMPRGVCPTDVPARALPPQA